MKKKPAALALTAPCENCPFRNDGHAIELRPGRVQGIVSNLLRDDRAWFPCHKTTHTIAGKKSWKGCRGAVVYLWKIGQPNVATRMGLAFGLITVDELNAQCGQVIGAEDLESDI